MELKRCIDMGINGTHGSYNLTPHKNQPNTEYILKPRARLSLNEINTRQYTRCRKQYIPVAINCNENCNSYCNELKH